MDPEEVQAVLESHEARWEKGYLTAVPLHLRAKLKAALDHHPSWWRESRRFCVQLRRLGCSYDEVAEAMTTLRCKRPSMMSAEERKVLLDMLEDPDSDVVAAIGEARAAAATTRKRRAA